MKVKLTKSPFATDGYAAGDIVEAVTYSDLTEFDKLLAFGYAPQGIPYGYDKDTPFIRTYKDTPRSDEGYTVLYNYEYTLVEDAND